MAKQQCVMLQLVVSATCVAILGAQAFVPTLVAPSQYSAHQDRIATTRTVPTIIHHQPRLLRIQPSPLQALFMSSSSTKEAEDETMGSSSPPLSEAAAEEEEEVEFSAQEVKIIEELHAKAGESSSPEGIQQCITDALPPKLVLKLRQAENNSNEAIRRMATELNQLLELRMKNAKETLQRLLQAGEIRKLDNLIGQAARNGQLDVAFFNVLSFNLKDAAMGSSSSQQVENENEEKYATAAATAAASRLQILQHIYTRCQEEVEKSIPPGSTLLNKLLRTREDSIRANLYRHYLTIQETNTIVTPDGKKVEIKSQTTPKSLVSIDEFCQAIALAVQQIRTVEQANGMDKVSAANMVETCRQIAKEARGILGEAYGVESTELEAFEQSLQPVFRPTSTESPYIKGTD